MIMVPMNSRMDKSMDSHYYILVYVTLGTLIILRYRGFVPFFSQTNKERETEKDKRGIGGYSEGILRN